MSKVWFITGASRGFGRIWTSAALERGDRVAAAARTPSDLDDLVERFGEALLPLRLDVNDRAADFAAVRRAHEHFGRIDVVVNNAGYGLFGWVEALTEAEVRAQLETNLFGAIWVTQAAVSVMRGQGGGHILQVSSIGGILAFPQVSLYNTSKWGLEGFSQALAREVRDFGIKVTIVEPGGYSTDWSGPSAHHAHDLEAYAEVGRRLQAETLDTLGEPGDPATTAAVLLAVVDAEQPPLRIVIGQTALETARRELHHRLDEWERWEHLSTRG